MKHVHYLDVPGDQITESGAQGVNLRTVIGEADGAPNFFMRVVSFEAGGSSPSHSHPWEHENFIVSGSGTLEVDGEVVNLKPGDVTYVPARCRPLLSGKGVHGHALPYPQGMICMRMP